MVKILTRAAIFRVLYGTMFVVILPLSLLFWASNLEKLIDLPVPKWGSLAVAGSLLGSFLIFKGMFDLLVLGKGLPMNAFPPRQFVTRGIYAWFSHPIYFGAALLSISLSLWFRSGSGLYVVTPVLILAMCSLVYGYEISAISRIYGDAVRQHRPVISSLISGKYRRPVVAVMVFIFFAMYLSVLSFLFGFVFVDNIILFAPVILVIGYLAFEYMAIWIVLKAFCEWVANSRHDWLFFDGRFRIINHSVYSGLAGVVGVGILAYIIGNSLAVLLLGVCTILGAAGFAQFRWGSASLLRPFGYWGAIIGGVLGLILIRYIFNIHLYQTAVGAVIAASFSQAIGRLRCLSQGCCHGIVTSKKMGIRVWQNQSRVVVLSGLKGEYIIPTQLFSILFNLLLGTLLFSIWLSHKFSGSFIVGLYFVLTGIERFTEDAYRGEKQTRQAKGLKENQWIAIAATVAGMIITVLPSPSITALGEFNLVLGWTSLLGGLFSALALSMDFPRSSARFSRLSG